MPQVAQTEHQQRTATSITEGKLFRDRLRDRYKATDYVRVINIDNEKFDWQYFPIDGEVEGFSDNGATRVIEGRQRFTSNFDGRLPGNEQIWSLGAGDSEVLVGANADLFIEGLYKKLVAKKRLTDTPKISETQARSFNWNDGLLQEQMIDKLFLGIENPTFNEPQRSQAPTKK